MEAVLQGPTGRIVLGPTPLTIGRLADNRVVVGDPKASSHHAEIRATGQGYSIVDLGSTNGTFVNNQRIERNTPRSLANGDRIRIGDTMFNYTATPATESYGPPGSFSDYTPTVAATTPYAEPAAGPPQYTGYGQGVQQPYAPLPSSPQQINVPPPQQYSPLQQQYPSAPPAYSPYPPPVNAPPASSPALPSYAAPVAPLPGAPVPAPFPPTPAPRKPSWLRIGLIVLAIVIILGGLGGAYLYLTRPQPVISVSSMYHVRSINAGSTGTSLHVSGQKFSANSAITFLLDGAPIVSGTRVQSDTNGIFQTDLMITSSWIMGDHTLTAEDANGNTTKPGIPVTIVQQGVAHTPGPNGSPPDDMSFTINISIQATDSTGKTLSPIVQTLTVTGQADPAGGTVCQSRDNGQPQSINSTFVNNGGSYTETHVYSCSGSYKSGKLTYTETVTSDKYTLSNNITCTATTPYTYEQLQGSFTTANMVSGTVSVVATKATCPDGSSITTNALSGKWTGQSST